MRFFVFLLCVGEAREQDGALVAFCHLESQCAEFQLFGPLFGERFLEEHLEGPFIAVHGHLMEVFLAQVVDVEAQAFGHAQHEPLGGDDEYLVFQVVADADTVEFEQAGHVASPRTLDAAGRSCSVSLFDEHD